MKMIFRNSLKPIKIAPSSRVSHYSPTHINYLYCIIEDLIVPYIYLNLSCICYK